MTNLFSVSCHESIENIVEPTLLVFSTVLNSDLSKTSCQGSSVYQGISVNSLTLNNAINPLGWKGLLRDWENGVNETDDRSGRLNIISMLIVSNNIEVMDNLTNSTATLIVSAASLALGVNPWSRCTKQERSSEKWPYKTLRICKGRVRYSAANVIESQSGPI